MQKAFPVALNAGRDGPSTGTSEQEMIEVESSQEPEFSSQNAAYPNPVPLQALLAQAAADHKEDPNVGDDAQKGNGAELGDAAKGTNQGTELVPEARKVEPERELATKEDDAKAGNDGKPLNDEANDGKALEDEAKDEANVGAMGTEEPLAEEQPATQPFPVDYDPESQWPQSPGSPSQSPEKRVRLNSDGPKEGGSPPRKTEGGAESGSN